VDTTRRSGASRRRRAAEPEETPEDDDEVEPEEEPAPKRRRPAPEPEEDDDEPEPAPKRRRRPEPEEEPEEDDPEDEPAPKRRVKGKAAGAKKGGLPQGVRTGWGGAEETLKAGGQSANRIELKGEPELVKFLEEAPFISCRQHWVSTEAGQGNRPYLCPGKSSCPLCDLGDFASPMYGFNVLHLSNGDFPAVKTLQIGSKAYQALKETATNKTTGKIEVQKGYFAVSKTGKGQKAQTNFIPVKERDLDDDWSEIFEYFEADDLAAIIEESLEDAYGPDIIKPTPMRQLEEIARYLSDD
jgi:hypothetical protein